MTKHKCWSHKHKLWKKTRKAIHRCTFGISEHECLWVNKFWTKFVALAQLGRGHVGACGQWSSSRLPRYVFARRDTLAAWGTLCQTSPHFQTSENRVQAGHGGQMSKHVNERCASWVDRCSAPPSWLKWARAIISNTSSSHSSEPSQTNSSQDTSSCNRCEENVL